jgi:hypothetical protein
VLRLLIGWGGVETDYTVCLEAGLKISEQLNMPSQMPFSLSPLGRGFVVPPQRAYVRYYSDKYDRTLFTGFIASEPVRVYRGLAQWTPTETAGQLFQYQFNCTSDEYLLNIKSVPFIPAFVNRTQGDILATLANILCPGFFDTTSQMQAGDLVPFFDYAPNKSWSEVAKEFADAGRFRYKVRDRVIYYQPYGDQQLGIEYDESKTPSSKYFTPKDLETTVLAVPIVNDVTMIGQAEAGNNHEDYALSNGADFGFAQANLPLLHKVFRGSSSLLVQDSWNSKELNLQQWFLFPEVNPEFDFSAGALNVVSPSGAPHNLGESYLSMQNGIELAGGLDLEIGEVTFNDYCLGVLGGIYTDTIYAASGLLAGWDVSSPAGVVFGAGGVGPIPGQAIGVSGVVMQPIFSGGLVGPALVSQINHNYVLQIVVHAPQYSRYTRVYRTIEGLEFGGAQTSVQGFITFAVQDFDIAAATGVYYTPKLTTFTVPGVVLPAFATYALVNNRRLNLTISSTTIAIMPLGGLYALEGPSGLMQPTGVLPLLPADSGDYIGSVLPWPSPASSAIFPLPGRLATVPTVEVLGNGFELQAAQITPGNSADSLSFYLQSFPVAGTPIRLQTWEEQAAVSRLQVSGSIASEAAIVGDDGLRSAIVTDLNPLPRTSEDCDAAALAYLQDRVGTYYNGKYTATSVFFMGLTTDAQFYPTVGRMFRINAPRRGLANNLSLVTTLSVEILEAQTEIVRWTIGFGADLHLEKLLKHFVDPNPPQVLTAKDKANPPSPRLTLNVDNSLLPDLNDVQADMSKIKPDFAVINVKDPYYGPIEVRRIDGNWGLGATPDLIDIVYGPQFTLRRTALDQIWFMRPVQNGLTSRRSKVIRIHWPLRPLPPLFQGVSAGTGPGPDGTLVTTPLIQLNFNGDNRNIFGLELRAADNRTILVQKPVFNLSDLLIDLTQTPLLWLDPPLNTDLSLYAYFFNQQWDFSEPLILDALLLQGTRNPYTWAPAWQAPLPGDAFTMLDVFGVFPSLGFDAQGGPIVQVGVKGVCPPNIPSTTLGEPILTAAPSASTGMLASGKYVVGVSLEDTSSSPAFHMTPLSNLSFITVTVNNGAIDIHLDHNPFSADIYIAEQDVALGFAYSGHMGIGVLNATVTSFQYGPNPAPDPLFDHLTYEVQKEWHSGIFGAQVQTLASGTIGIIPPTPATGAFAASGLVGRTVSCLAHADQSIDVTYMNFYIASQITSSGIIFLTIGPPPTGPNAGVSPPDLTSDRGDGHPILSIGDVITVRMLVQSSTDTSFTDAYLVSPFALTGLISDDEHGRVAWVIGGADAGDRQQISTITNGGTTVNIAGKWASPLDSTSIIVIVDAAQLIVPTNPFQILHKGSLGGVLSKVNVQNIAAGTWLMRAFTTDKNGNFNDTQWVRIREIYSFGAQGSRLVTATDVMRVSDKTIEYNTSAIAHSPDDTIPGGCDSTQTTITFGSGANVINGTYLQVDLERMFVVDGTGDTRTVLRGAWPGGLFPASGHASGVVVTVPGALTFTLLPIGQFPNVDFIGTKITDDINFVKIIPDPSTPDELPDGSMAALLPDNSADKGTLVLKAPGV